MSPSMTNIPVVILTQAEVGYIVEQEKMKLKNKEKLKDKNNKTDIQRLHFAQRTKQSEFWLRCVN